MQGSVHGRNLQPSSLGSAYSCRMGYTRFFVHVTAVARSDRSSSSSSVDRTPISIQPRIAVLVAIVAERPLRSLPGIRLRFLSQRLRQCHPMCAAIAQCRSKKPQQSPMSKKEEAPQAISESAILLFHVQCAVSLAWQRNITPPSTNT